MILGDTFQFIDGKNLEIKADIIRDILFDEEILNQKCIVVSVIGPNSTGKSTLMDFCFGTQFSTSYGRCTSGINFALKKIPPEMQNGSDVEYLIILDTEGLNSHDRAEGDRSFSEYDHKIALFTLLCSDFLIINSSGDMMIQMKDLLKICAVRYNQLRPYQKAPKILYTFVKNNGRNPEDFFQQIASLRADVLECSDSPTFINTADELFEFHEECVKVLGSAYDQKVIEKDSAKGISYSTEINVCAPLFGLHTTEVWHQVKNFIQSGKRQFKQIGAWLQEAEEHWSLIDRDKEFLAQFANFQERDEMKSVKKIQQKINQLWEQYIDTKIMSKDNQKAEEQCRKLYEKFKDGQNIEPLRRKFIFENDQEKDKDLSVYIEEKYQLWLNEPEQRYIIVDKKLKHMKDCNLRMKILKNDYKLLLENKFKELQMTQIHTSTISDLYCKARNLFQVIKTFPEVNQDKQINEEFEKGWGKLEELISSDSKMIKDTFHQRKQYQSRTFQNVDKFMTNITQINLNYDIKLSDTIQMHPNLTLPKELVDFLTEASRHINFMDKNNQKEFYNEQQFFFDQSMLEMLNKDPQQRIFGPEDVKEKYLPLHKMLKVDYSYFQISDFEETLKKSSVSLLIEQYLGKKKYVLQTEPDNRSYVAYYKKYWISQTDDQEEILKSINSLFYELGQAGFCTLMLPDEYNGTISSVYDFNKIILAPLYYLNVAKRFEKLGIFNDKINKEGFVDTLMKEIRWRWGSHIMITPRVQFLLRPHGVVIPLSLQPNISFEQHQQVCHQLTIADYQIPLSGQKYQSLLSFLYEYHYSSSISVTKFLRYQNLDFRIKKNYNKCVVRPKYHDLAESFEQDDKLFELAKAVVDWRQIVLDIDQSVSPQIDFELTKTQNNGKQANFQIDLKSVLERSLINIEQIEKIKTLYPNSLERQNLSYYVSHKLRGFVTWVTCVIIQYKLQMNVIKNFNEEIGKIKMQKPIVFKKFSEIAKGQTTATTAQFADDLFSYTFKKFNYNCLKNTNQVIIKYLESQLVKDKFDTETVYKQMDETYISQADQNEYQKCIDYATDPVKMFTDYVNELKINHIVKRQEEEFTKYQQRVISNLKTLQERLVLISLTMKSYEDQKDDSINFFEVTKAGKKILGDVEKEEIVQIMSPILLNTLRKILDGTYTVGPQLLTLTINDQIAEYSFTVKQKDLAKNIQGSPFNDLQMLVFEKSKSLEFINDFFERLDVCKDNSNFGVCTDLRFMVGKLNDLLEQKISEIEGLGLKDIKPKVQDDIIHSYIDNAIGCNEVCKFCNRKCELAPHQAGNENHNCNKRSHSFGIFGGRSFVTSQGEEYPSLTTCDELKHETKIKIVCKSGIEVRLWSEIQNIKQSNWTYKGITNHTYNWVKNYQELKKFWKVHGQKYCTEKNVKYIERNAFNEIVSRESLLYGHQIVIICIEDQKQMKRRNKYVSEAVKQGKKLEKYFQQNHANPAQVHIQLWFYDCHGVNQVYKGQSSSTIPYKTWNRTACYGDGELGTGKNFDYGKQNQLEGAVRILNQEVNSLLANSNYNRVHWFYFTDRDNSYPHDEMVALQQTMITNRAIWTDQGKPKLHPMIISNQFKSQSLCMMKVKIDEIMKDIWYVEDACALKQYVETDQLAKTMIEQFTFN